MFVILNACLTITFGCQLVCSETETVALLCQYIRNFKVSYNCLSSKEEDQGLFMNIEHAIEILTFFA